jgi:hypothetical protein
MANKLPRLLSLSVLLAAPVAVAETASPAPASPAGEVSAPAPAESAPAQAADSAPEAAKPNDVAEQLNALQTKVAALEEANTANQTAIASASKLKFSGFVQGRYEWHQEAVNGLTYNSSGVGSATNTSRFMVRHAYFTADYKGTNAEYRMQIDPNTKDGVVGIKDIYATFVDTWTPLNLKLTVGQFKYPFGYELLQSDADREMPERATIEKFFFDGERDRGVRLQGGYDFFNFQVALVNGTLWDGSKNLAAAKDTFGGNDPNEFKDWVGRLGVDFGSFVGGVSGYFGKGLYIKPGAAATATTAAKDPTPDSRWKYRLGADLQGYIDIPGLGGLALKGEVMYGKDSAREYHAVAADPCNTSATWGFILTAVQNIGGNFGVVGRFDGKDTLSGSISDKCTTQKNAADADRVLTVGGGLLYYASSNIKATVTYEHPSEQAPNKKDNDFAMAQLQARF